MSKTTNMVFSLKLYQLIESPASPHTVQYAGKHYKKLQLGQNFIYEDVLLYFVVETKTNIECEYVKVDLSIGNQEKGYILESKTQTLPTPFNKNTPQGTTFKFRAIDEGKYQLKANVYYREKSFVQGMQQVSQKVENAFHALQILRVFQIKDKVIHKDKDTVITYPLLVQMRVENVTQKTRAFRCQFLSQKFFIECLDPQENYDIQAKQYYNILYRVSPKDLQTIYQTTRLGTFKVLWDKDAQIGQVVEVKFKQILLLKASTLVKSIPKKDICNIRIKFQKKLMFDFGELSIRLKESEMSNIKVVNISQTKIRLTERSEDILDLSVIGMTSGMHTLKGLYLFNLGSVQINYENDIVLTVANEHEVKAEEKIFDKTDTFDIFELEN